MRKSVSLVLMLLQFSIAAAFAELRPALSLGGGYYLNGVDFIFPQSTPKGNSPLSVIDIGLYRRDALQCGIKGSLSRCRHEEWLVAPDTGTGSLNYRGRFDALSLLAEARYLQTIPEAPNLNFYLSAGLGVLHYRYAFTIRGTEVTALDVCTERDGTLFCALPGLGVATTLHGAFNFYIECDYLYAPVESGAPDVKGLTIHGGISYR